MATSDRPPLFRIGGVASQPTAPPPEAPPPGPGAEATGGVFSRPAEVLSFLAAVAGAGLADRAGCRRSADGEWWAEVAAAWPTAAPLVRVAGGRPYAAVGERWLEVPILGEPRCGDESATPDLDSWTPVDLGELVATMPLRPGPWLSSATLGVMVPGALGRWVLRRATALGLGVRLVAARRWRLGGVGASPLVIRGDRGGIKRRLRGDGEESGVLLVRLRAERGEVPPSLVRALASLPYALVGRPVGTDERLLVDVRHRAPLAETLLGRMIPAGEIWLLGGSDVGHWRLQLAGGEIDGAHLLKAPEIAVVEAPVTARVRMPEAIAVRLVARSGGRGQRSDAVLVDDAELGWLQRFLMTRPVGERAFLMPGAERHLLTAPGGLPGVLPFGVPLTRVGPGGLYVETGLDFFPPLPEGARREVFGLAGGEVVAVVREGAFRFAPDHLVPAWTLWVGAAPEIRGGLSARGQELVGSISARLREEETRDLADEAEAAVPSPEGERSQLLAEAQRLELAGELVRAAELLEAAGELGPAGRLYERAADTERSPA